MKKTYNIKGMHCVSCEVLLGDNLSDIKCIKNSKISHKDSTATIEYEGEAPDQDVEKAIKKSGYELLSENQASDKTALYKNILHNIVIFLTVGFVLFFISKLKIDRLYPDLGSNINFLVALSMGIVASLSTCLALTGGIVMGFSAKLKYQEENPPLLTRAKPQIYFHLGRLVGFFFLGGLLGLFGQAIGFSLSGLSILTFLVAILMLYMGLNIMGLVPNITSLGFHLPTSLAKKIKKQEKNDKAYMPIILGALTFFLPCGFTQSMQLTSVASGSFLSGALLMFFFALGTMPVLFAVGFGSSFAQKKDFRMVNKFIGAFIIFFGLWSLNNSLVLAGSPITFNIPSGSASEVTQEAKITKDSQTVRLDIDYTFVQREIKILKDVPVVWEINPINITGCSNEVIIPSMNLTTGKLTKGQMTTLEFTPTKTGILPFSCWMGMITGRFVIVEDDSELSATKANIELSNTLNNKSASPAATCDGSCGSPTCGGGTSAGCGCGG